MNKTTRMRVAAVVAALYFVLTSACAWSVPADPGLNAIRRSPPQRASVAGVSEDTRATLADDPQVAAIYYRKCSQCHAPFHPTYLPASLWPAYVRKYAPGAGLFGRDRQRVLAWLQAHAE